MKIPAWDEIRVPISVIGGVIIVVGTLWSYVHTTFVHASDFMQYQKSVEHRILEEQRRRLETEVLKLEVKRDTFPQRFDAIDRALLRKHEEQLREVKSELQRLQSK